MSICALIIFISSQVSINNRVCVCTHENDDDAQNGTISAISETRAAYLYRRRHTIFKPLKSSFIFLVCVRASVVFLLMFAVGCCLFSYSLCPTAAVFTILCLCYCCCRWLLLLLFKIISFKFKYSEISPSFWSTFSIHRPVERWLLVLWHFCNILRFCSHLIFLCVPCIAHHNYHFNTIFPPFFSYVSKLSWTSFSRCTQFASHS